MIWTTIENLPIICNNFRIRLQKLVILMSLKLNSSLIPYKSRHEASVIKFKFIFIFSLFFKFFPNVIYLFVFWNFISRRCKMLWVEMRSRRCGVNPVNFCTWRNFQIKFEPKSNFLAKCKFSGTFLTSFNHFQWEIEKINIYKVDFVNFPQHAGFLKVKKDVLKIKWTTFYKLS